MPNEKANDADFLSEIYRGAKMGVETIDTIMPKVESKKMKDELLREQSEFRKFEEKAQGVLTRHNVEPKAINKMQEMSSWIGIQMNTAIDSSTSHIADLLMQGNQMGVIGITKTKNKHPKANEDITKLADELVTMQENNIERLKSFLG